MEKKFLGVVENLIERMDNYEFVFIAHSVTSILATTSSISSLIQQKDQHIIAVISLIHIKKLMLHQLRYNDGKDLLEGVNSFYSKHDVFIPNIEANMLTRVRYKQCKFYHHFCIGIFLPGTNYFKLMLF